jgi:hypothetical protein
MANVKKSNDTDIGEDNRPQIHVRPSDMNQSLRDNETAKEDESTKTYERSKITIMDRTLSDVLDRTLNFVVYSFGDYQVQVKKAELLVDNKDSKDNNGHSFRDRLMIHAHALSLFISDGDNCIYIGILLIVLSIIIYFVNITTS